MSLNQLVLNDTKPWLNVQANNLIIDGDLIASQGQPNFVLGYLGENRVSFSPQLKSVNLSFDSFGLIPLQNVGDVKLDFELGPTTPVNFQIDVNQNLKCQNAGVYLLIFKFVQDATTNPTNRPNPYLEINAVAESRLSLRLPYATTSFSQYCGGQMSSIFQLNVADELSIQLANQPSGTISMVNESFASNLLIIKVA